MSLEMASERVCYVHCNFCNTILAVNVPCSSMFNIVTVRCGHCANLLSVHMGSLPQTLPAQDLQMQKQHLNFEDSSKDSGSSSKCDKFSSSFESAEPETPRMPPIHPPEKRQRVPSAYNRFIKEEIQRIKASNPDISHREAFSTAAKNRNCVMKFKIGDFHYIELKWVKLTIPNRKFSSLLSFTNVKEIKWAHFPHIHFGLKLDGNKQAKLDQAYAEGTQKSNGFY